ncbi:hypothetical protein V6N12_013895 [Hibiscus sabdariffa]|uniref:C-JID domain-containing protein n=2 Tax=Hibiscus sabdariffa TaxID=183260 RepID=A0ABR1ZSE5_9ROSI
MLYLGYMDFSTPSLLSEKEKVLEDKVDSVSLPDELKYLRWDYFPFKSFSPSFNPENLVTLKLRSDRIEQLWNENHQDLDKLRVIDLCYCKKLRKIPNLSSAINLQRLECTGCESLVELPRLSHLTSLEKLDFEGCHKLRKFPELPNIFLELNLSHTEIEEVPDSIEHLGQLKKLSLQYSRVEHISSNISKLESLRELDLFACGSLKTLSELPRYLLWLDADECTSLEKVSFADHNSNPFHSLQDGDDDALRKEDFFMSFSNCRSLNQDSIENIAVNAMLQIESLAQRWARKKAISQEKHKRVSFGYKLLCCFPGNEVPANVFNCISMNYSLTLKITPNGFSGSRFLAFAICLVADLTHANDHLEVICKYQLTDASGEKFTRKPHFFDSRPGGYRGDHVLILLSKDMVLIDNDYEEASFEFYIRDNAWKDIEVEKCGVHVFYVDAESYIIIDDKSKPNFDSAIEMRPEDERRFGIDCEEGDGGP